MAATHRYNQHSEQKTFTKENILYASIYIKLKNKQNYSEKNDSLWWVSAGRDIRSFLGCWTFFTS